MLLMIAQKMILIIVRIVGGHDTKVRKVPTNLRTIR